MKHFTQEEFKPRVAQEDIPVYKVVEKYGEGFCSLYYKYHYEIGNEYSIRAMNLTFEIETMKIEDAFHSYSTECWMDLNGRSLDIRSISGQRVICSLEKRYLDNIYKLNCVIPKGATYYLNRHGEYASNQIRVMSAETIELQKGE